MKLFKIILFWIIVLFGIEVFSSTNYVYASDSNDVNKIVESIDKYYKVFVDYVDGKTNTIWFEKIRTRIQDRIRNTLLSWLQNKIDVLEWNQKVVFQSLWLKVSQRKNTIQLSTSVVVNQWELINAVNDFRKNNWLSILSYNDLLSKAAYTHANDMYLHFPYDTNGDGVKELIAHTGTDWTKVKDRVERLGYIPYFVWENIAYNQISVNEVITDWINSPTHYENLITEKATQIWVAKLWSYRVLVIWTERKNL